MQVKPLDRGKRGGTGGAGRRRKKGGAGWMGVGRGNVTRVGEIGPSEQVGELERVGGQDVGRFMQEKIEGNNVGEM